MNETAILRAKVPARRLQRAEKTLQKLGLTPTVSSSRTRRQASRQRTRQE
jgi:hypothetical protein